MKQLPLRTEVKNILSKNAPGAFDWCFDYTDKSVLKGKIVCRIKADRSVIRNIKVTERVKINTALKQLAKRRSITLQEVEIRNPEPVKGVGTYRGSAYIYFNKTVNTDF